MSAARPQGAGASALPRGRLPVLRLQAAAILGREHVPISPGHIHPEVAQALQTLGLDASNEKPTLLTRDTIAASDFAITLGSGEECPYVPGVRYVDRPVADPGGQDEATVRAIIADLDVRVRDLLAELVPDLDLPPSVVP